MQKDLISIIVPVYNVEKYIKICLLSIINQTYKNIEIIVVDDGSTDKSGIICDQLKKSDQRIEVFHQNNLGLSCARNAGILKSHGQFLCFVDSDDYIESNMIEELKKSIDKFESDISICDYYCVKYNKRKNNKYNFKYNRFAATNKEIILYFYDKYDKLMVPVWNKLYKRNIFDNTKFPEGKIFEDSFVLCDILKKIEKYSFIILPLYNYVYRKESIVNSFNVNHFDCMSSFNKKIELFTEFGNNKLVLEERNKKMNMLIINMSKMKRYNIKDRNIEKRYYHELKEINKTVSWKASTLFCKLYKIFGKKTIICLAFLLKIRDTFRNN